MVTNMVTIEDTVICIDNSDYMRNEDMDPNRLQSQQDSINIICHHILSTRVENRIALLTTADNPQLIQSLTSNEINVMRKLYSIAIKGDIKLSHGIQLSILVLKHNQQMDDHFRGRRKRVIVFVGSPVTENSKQLESLAKKVIKSNISLDIVCFGSENVSQIEILKSFVAKVGKDSHLVVVPKDRGMTNVLADSPLLSQSSAVSLANENTDPELALALKMSTQGHTDQFNEDLKTALELSAIDSKHPKSEAFKTSKAEPKNDQNIQKAFNLSLDFMKKNNIPIDRHKSQTKTVKQNPRNPLKSNSQVMSEQEQLALALQMSLLHKHSKQSKETKNTNQKKSKFEKKDKK